MPLRPRASALLRTVGPILAVAGSTAGSCAPSEGALIEWRPIASAEAESRLAGAWENVSTGHLVSFSATGSFEVFHRLDDFCIRDTGVVPDYGLYAFPGDRDALLLQYYDHRGHEELLQAPLEFRRVHQIPAACRRYGEGEDLPPTVVFDLIWRAFDRYYRFFDERGVDWEAQRRRFEPAAASARSNDELFDILAQMLGTLRDGHVNLSRGDRTFNAGRPLLRSRLAEAWAESGSDLSEGVWVSAWHRGVLESVYAVLDSGSLRSGAADAVEWGTIADTVGYVRVNRFTRFTDQPAPRPAGFDSLRVALAEMVADLADTKLAVVDVALNGGGSDAAALTVAAVFADETRSVLEYQAAGAPDQEIALAPARARYLGPVVLLTSEVTASAAESFVNIMRAFPHVLHAGERTRGGLSSLLPKPFPNGFMATISYQRVLDAEGILYEVTGIPPEREVTLFPDENLHGGFRAALERIADP